MSSKVESNGHDVASQVAALIRPNTLKERMAQGGLGAAWSIAMAASTEVIHLVKLSGYPAIAINLEHNRQSIETASELCCAALTQGLTPLVVVPSLQSDWVCRILDNGAQGIILPRTQDAAMTRELGERGLAYTPQMQYQIPDFRYTQQAGNDTTLTIPMIETLRGLDNCEEIAAVEGVNGIFIGVHDLSDDMGIAGQFEDERIHAAIGRISEAAKAASTPDNKIYIGLGGLDRNIEHIAKLRLDFDNIGFCYAGRDSNVLFAGMKQVIQGISQAAAATKGKIAV